MKRASAWARTVGLSVVAGLFLVTGCSADEKPTANDRDGQRQGDGTSASADDLVLPIDAYGLTTEEAGALARARELLVGDCLREYGFTVDSAAAVARSERSARLMIDSFGLHGNKRRYGVVSMEVANKYGYHLPAKVEGGAGAPITKKDADIYGSGPMTPAKEMVLSGRPTAGSASLPEVNGKRVPPTGCIGKADSQIAKTGSTGQADLVARIRAESFDSSVVDPAVTKAIGTWSECMKVKGYDVKRPEDATGAFKDTAPVTAREIAMAQADVTCKQSTGLVEAWRNVEIEYQKRKIESHAAELQAIKDSNADQLRRASEALAGRAS